MNDNNTDTIVLQPVAMVIPNRACIYSPSHLEPPIEVGSEEFRDGFAMRPRRLRVCFDESPSSQTIVQRSELVTVYFGKGLTYWYCIVGVRHAELGPGAE